ncbi:hypothetical protein HGRIS_004393 [Hohenbuehelia grisea]|uniref:Uncharacterized protein n=1 Tax=Hohenbuehelia grisea TaxID=104357 RepID=A0ABR3JBU9_9AGAR
MLNSLRLCSLSLFTFLAIRGSLAVPLDKRAAPPILILTNRDSGTPGAAFACSNAEKNRIADAIDEVKMLAVNAATRLRTPGVQASSGFHAFFGTGDPEWIAKTFFDPLASLDAPFDADSATLASIPNHAITITCVRNEGPTPMGETNPRLPSVIKLFPKAFTSIADINSDAESWRLHRTYTSGIYGTLSHVLLHELLHAAILIPEPNRCIDVEYTISNSQGQPSRPFKAYGIDVCQRLEPAQKLRNVQNFEWFAFLELATPEIYQDDCNGTPGPIPSHTAVPLPPIVQQRRAVGSTVSVPTIVGGSVASFTGGPVPTLSTLSTPSVPVVQNGKGGKGFCAMIPGNDSPMGHLHI